VEAFSPNFKAISPSESVYKAPNTFFAKPETNMSFRVGDDIPLSSSTMSNLLFPPQNSNKPSSQLNPSEKEFYESQISHFKQLNEETKSRYERLLTEEREKWLRREVEFTNLTEELKGKHKNEIRYFEENSRNIKQTYSNEGLNFKAEIEREVQMERERLSFIHKHDLENQESIHSKNMQQQKKLFEEQNDTLRKQLQQQLEFNKLANKVETSSNKIEDILLKFNLERDKCFDSEKYSQDTREKFLNDYEEKLKENEKQLHVERENIHKLRQEFELRHLEKKRENQEERVRLEKEILRLQELQNSLKNMEFHSKEKYEREKLELSHKQSEWKIEIETIKNNYYQKLSDLEYKERMMTEDKSYFEKYKDEVYKNIEVKLSNFEERREKFLEEEKQIKGRVKVLQQKEFYIKEKFDEIEKMKEDCVEKYKSIEKDKKDLVKIGMKLEHENKIIKQKEQALLRKEEEFGRRFHDFDYQRADLNSEKLIIEQSKAELRLRMEAADMLRIKYVNGNNLYENQIPIHSHNNFFRSTQTKDEINQPQFRSMSNSFVKKSFNADEYFETLKNRLNDRDSLSGIQKGSGFRNSYIDQEREFIKLKSTQQSNVQQTPAKEVVNNNSNDK
jgi:hypothetical protein